MKKLENRGITLIALVITIVVLLLLAGISISMISGQDGILNKAANAKDKTAKSEHSQNIEIAKGEALLSQYSEKVMTYDELKANFTNITNEDDYNNNIVNIVDGVPIPKGFAHVEGTRKDTGLVVVDGDGNEFVWIPVPDVVYDQTTTITVGAYTPMARIIGESNDYQGVVYNLTQASENQKVYDLTTYGVGTTLFREPSLITGDNNVTSAIPDIISGTTCDVINYNSAGNYSSVEEFGQDMQNEYNNMIKSVNKYKGFYVGRYELGIENGKAVSKNAYINENVITADSDQTITKYWYGLYNKQRTMAKDNNLTSVESSMIWGSQYTAMMNWMIKTGNVVGAGYDKYKTNITTITGKSDIDIINNIYDLYGAHFEWTMEADGNGNRVSYGDDYGPTLCPSYPISHAIDTSKSYIGSRTSLYIK